MIDYFALTLVHGLLVIAFFRLVQDDALDPEKPQLRRRNKASSNSSDEAAEQASKTE